MRLLRRIFQIAILGSVIYLAAGWGDRSFENFCPFGGIESMYALATKGFTTCAISPWNFAVFFGALGLALIAKKSFCSWICPVGFIYEILGKLQNKIFEGRDPAPQQADKVLRYLRWVVLAAVLYPTYKTGELIFREYDPYYLFFSGFGHGTTATVSLMIVAALVAIGLVIKMGWCRYLCPMSALMDLFSFVSPTVLKRDVSICKSCAKCDSACDHNLKPSQHQYLHHVDCSNCLNCVEACPEKDCLTLRLHNRFKGEEA